MIDHFGIIVKDIEASKTFYEAVLAPLGYAKTIDESYGVGFSNPDQTQHTGIFWLGQGEPSSPLHFAFGSGRSIAPRGEIKPLRLAVID